MRNNIDTDAIIPSREMKRVSRHGLAEGLFAGWRYLPGEDRQPNPEFILNQPRYAGASILAVGRNFGCGSSREHAVWALAEFGIRVILAPTFASIFERNCSNNGLLTVKLAEHEIAAILSITELNPRARTLRVDLALQSLEVEGLQAIPFHADPASRDMLLKGWDPIDHTLQYAESIEQFESSDRQERRWAYELRTRF